MDMMHNDSSIAQLKAAHDEAQQKLGNLQLALHLAADALCQAEFEYHRTHAVHASPEDREAARVLCNEAFDAHRRARALFYQHGYVALLAQRAYVAALHQNTAKNS